jgi:cell division protein FtsB
MLHKFQSFIQYLILILALILTFSLIKSISKIAGSERKITEEANSVKELEKQNTDLKTKLEGVKSTQFIEREARDKLGLAKIGEIVVVLPDSDSLKALAPKVQEEKFFLPEPIWKKWMMLFL